jgi:hypothetical protein
MHKRISIAFTLALLAALFGAAYLSADDSGRPFSTALTGAAEVPGPGDPDGSGQARIRLNSGQGEVCYLDPA